MGSLADLRALAERWIEAHDPHGVNRPPVGPRYGTLEEQASLARGVRSLVAVAEAAQAFERAFQRSLGSASGADVLLRDQAQENLLAALAGLGITAEETSR